MRELTIKLEDEEAASLEEFARSHGMTIEEAIRQLVLQHNARSTQVSPSGQGIHEEVRTITGIVPPDVDAAAEYRDHFARDES